MESEAALLKALAEPTRLRLIVLLALNGETCVCELAAALAAPEFRISRHLGIMKTRGLVSARRQGTWMHYRLAIPRTKLENCLQDCFRDCLADHPKILADRQRLQTRREQRNACCRKRSAPDTQPERENHDNPIHP